MRRYALLLAAVLAPVAAHAQLPLLHTFQSPNPSNPGIFGVAVAAVPDVNGDGRGDVIVGAPSETSLITTRLGRAYVFSGATGLPLDTLVSPAPETDGRFGQSVAGVPDLNGDGRGEYLVGAWGETAGGAARAGRVYLLAGQTEALLLTLVSPNPSVNGGFGLNVAVVPDVNGDGRADFLIGTTESIGGTMNAGRAYLFNGATGVLLRTLTSPNREAFGYFGLAVAGVTDVDGDGRGDLLVGARSEDTTAGSANQGRAYLFSGATGALLRTLTGSPARDGDFGKSVSAVPDADGDGRADLLIGAPGDAGAAPESRRAYLFSGTTGVLLHTLTSPSAGAGGDFGFSVAGVTDVNGDGRGDLLIGAWSDDLGADQAGGAYLFSGATGALLRVLSSPNPKPAGNFGIAVAGVPDVDGDGRGDLLVGAQQEDGGGSNAGRAYLFTTGTLVAGEPDAGAATLAFTAAPNPARGNATLAFTLDRGGYVRLALTDVLGREVAVLVDGERPAGAQTVALDASHLTPGVYVARLVAEGRLASRVLTVVR